MTALTEIGDGLSCFELLTSIKENKEVFAPVFCISDMFLWDHETFLSVIHAEFSEEGSNKRRIEITIHKLFLDFVEQCFKDGENLFIIFSTPFYFYSRKLNFF